jgi:hypothetical protein
MGEWRRPKGQRKRESDRWGPSASNNRNWSHGKPPRFPDGNFIPLQRFFFFFFFLRLKFTILVSNSFPLGNFRGFRQYLIGLLNIPKLFTDGFCGLG